MLLTAAYSEFHHDFQHRLGTLVGHVHGLGKLLDGVALGHKVAQIHASLVDGLANKLKVLALVHVVSLEVQLVLLVHLVGEAYAVQHQSVLDELPAAAGDACSLVQGGLVTEGQEGHIYAQPVGKGHDFLIEVLLTAVHGVLGAHLLGLVQIELGDVGNDYQPRLVELGAQQVAYAYGACADDADGAVLCDLGVANGVHAVGHRLDIFTLSLG